MLTTSRGSALRASFDDFRGDFRGGGWENFEANLRRVRPDGRFIDLDSSHPSFHSFFIMYGLTH